MRDWGEGLRKMACIDCVFWVAFTERSRRGHLAPTGYGECRAGEAIVSSYDAGDGCGSFRYRTAPGVALARPQEEESP